MTSSGSLSNEAQGAISILRALIVSIKQPAKLTDLFREYYLMVGSRLQNDSVKFGFRKVEDFLKASGEFCLINCYGEICVTAQPSRDSSHIREMVSRQRAPKKRANRGGSSRSRLPFKSDQSWNTSSYSSNVYRNLPTRRSNGGSSNLSSRVNLNRFQQQSRNTGHSNNNLNQKTGDTNNNCNQNSNRNLTSGITSSSINNITKPVPLMQVKVQIDNSDLREHLNEKKKINAANNLNSSRPLLGQNGKSGGKVETFGEYMKKELPEADIKSTVVKNGLEDFPKYLNDYNQKKVNENGNVKSVPKNSEESNKTFLMPTISTSKISVQAKLNQAVNIPKIPKTTPESSLQSSKVSSVQNRLKITFQNNHVQTNSSVTVNSPPILPIDPSNVSVDSNSSLSKYNSIPTTPSNGSPQTDGSLSPALFSLSSSSSLGNSITDKFTVIDQAPKKIIHDFQFNPNLSSVISLTQYCIVRGFPEPKYEILQSKYSNKRIQCRVNINNIMYSTYPDDFNNINQAKEACAKNAIHGIQISEQKQLVPICMDSDCELSLKIYQELKLHPRGIFARNFPDIFEKSFEQSLPDHWFSIIQNSSQFLLEPTAGDNFILFANTDYLESSCASNASEELEQDYTFHNSLELPWNQKYWNVFITNCVSTVEIWGRIIDKDYSEQLDSLLTDIEMAMLTDKKRPESITTGQMYLVCMSECWHRVRLEKIDKANGKCLCVFVDFGDDDWLSMDQLYICERKFLELPAQAISFSLFGLEDFAENPKTKNHINIMLSGKSLVAEILTKRETYEVKNNDDDNDEFISKIQIVLYDTSSNEDVNLNPLLLNKFCDETEPPELKRNGATNVNITYVNDIGEIFLQVRSLDLKYVEKLIYQLVQSKFNEEQHKVTINDVVPSKLFLIKDNTDNRWYRGSLNIDNEQNNTKSSDKYFNIFYADHGNIKKTHISQIFRLESLSAALSRFPAQAIKTKLHNLPPMTNNIVARIKGLLRINYPAIVKLAVVPTNNSKNVVPQINAYVRFENNESLCNVNEAIRMEHELERASEADLELFNSKSPSPPLSPQHPSNVMSEMTTLLRNVSIKTPDTIQVATLNKGRLQEISSNCWIPDIGELFNVLVTVSSNPFNFLVQSYNDFPQYQDLMLELQEYCQSNNEFIPSELIEVGEAYAALKDGTYYRATVESVFPSGTSCVCFCDCGDVTVVNNNTLKTLPSKFRIMPKQAIHAKLYGIVPTNRDWTGEDCIRFRELTLGKTFASVVKNVTVDNFYPNKPKVLELTLIDVSTDEDIYIHEILINEKRAKLLS